MQVCHPLGMWSPQLLMPIDILQSLVVSDKDELLLHQGMSLMFKGLNNGIEL